MDDVVGKICESRIRLLIVGRGSRCIVFHCGREQGVAWVVEGACCVGRLNAGTEVVVGRPPKVAAVVGLGVMWARRAPRAACLGAAGMNMIRERVRE